MAYLSPFLRVRINGVFGSATGVEQWSTGFKLHLVGGSTDATPFLESIAPAVSTFFGGTALKAGVNTFLTELTGAVIGTDGKYLGGATQATKRHTYGTPVSGAYLGVHDWPFSTVLSLRSSVLGRGPGSHGRMYWPSVGQQVDTNTGRFAAATTATLKDAAVTLLQAINAAGEATFGAGNVIVNASPVGAGHRAVVNRVLVGNRPDHIERRENAVAEAYSSGNV